MVKHGTAKKRRRGLKVSRKAPKHRDVRIASAVPSEIKPAYDKSKSPADNLASFGLDADANHFKQKSVPGGHGDKKNAAFLGFAVVPESDDLAEKNPKRRRISEADQQYIVLLIRRHGEDYKAMERNIQLNVQQHTENKLKRMADMYLALPDKEKLVAL